MKVDARRWRDLSEDDLRECDDLEMAVRGPPEDRPHDPSVLSWAPIEPESDWVVRVWDQEVLVSFVVISERNVAIGGRTIRAACIRGMRTHPDYRRRGFGTAAMNRAAGLIWKEVRPEMALLLSSEMAVSFYRRLGWDVVSGPVLCEQPGGRINYSERLPHAPAMVLLPPGGEAPEGPIDLCGLPF
jgi:aminoglycoside 2'-N-acetyltransferase I